MKTDMSRRSFLSAMALTGAGAAAAGLAGCAPQGKSDDESSAASNSDSSTTMAETGGSIDWLGSAPEITDDMCTEVIDTDVLVIGYGEAGTAAAFSAAEEGAKVLVLEKHFTLRYGGNAHAYLNSKAFAEYGMEELDPQKVVWEYAKETQYVPDLSLISLWAYRGHEVIDYLMDLVKDDEMPVFPIQPYEGYEKDSQITGLNYSAASLGRNDDRNNVWLNAIQSHAAEKGIEVRYETPAQRLIQDDSGRVIGAYAKDVDGNYIRVNTSKGVIVCAGDYGSNEDMIKVFQSEAAQRLYDAYGMGGGPAGAYTAYMEADEQPKEVLNDGLGIKMCCWAGARMECGTHGYNTWTEGGANCKPYLAVNSAGARFFNEATSMMVSSPVVIAQPEPYYWQILDQNGVDNPLPGYLPMKAPVEGAIDTTGWPTANTLEELAEQIGADPATLVASVERYNELCEKGVDEDFCKEAQFMVPVTQPPYYAGQQHHVWTVTFGGVYANNKLEVLNEEGLPIPGLYAAGNTIGRRFGWHYESSFMGCSNAFAETHGWFAAKSCVADN